MAKIKYHATTDGNATGVMTYWTLPQSVAIAPLIEAIKPILGDNGLPKTPSHTAVLKRVLDKIDRPVGVKEILIRPVGKRRSGAYAIVEEFSANEGKEIAPVVVGYAHVSGEGKLDTELMPDRYTAKYNFERMFAEQQGAFSTTELSAWLVNLVTSIWRGVNLRPESGGFYYVHRQHMPTLSALADAVKNFGIKLYEIEMMQTAKAVSAVLDAISSDLGAEFAKVEKFLEENSEVGQRSLNVKTRDLDEMRVKLKAFEELLGEQLDPLFERVSSLKARVSNAFAVTHAAELGQDQSDGSRILDLRDGYASEEGAIEDMAARGTLDVQ